MKSFRKLLLLLLAFSLSVSLFACGGGGDDDDDDDTTVCTQHTDNNDDGICDTCSEPVDTDPESELVLIENGQAKFKFVLASDVSSEVAAALSDSLNPLLAERNVDVEIVTESADNVSDVEVLIGSVTTRGKEYEFDKYSLGKEGYIFKIVGNKVLINAGSDETLIFAIMDFGESVLGTASSQITSVTMTEDDEVHKIQDNYDVTSIKVSGEDIKDYTISVDTESARLYSAALTLQDTIYDRVGYWLDVVELDEATDKSIVFKAIDRVYNDNSFVIKTSGTKLIIECAFANMAERAIIRFVTQYIDSAEGEISFDGQIYKQDISFVTYEDFEAVGDGRVDDFVAIYETHKFANECGNTVKATPGKRYYIHDTRYADADLGEETPTIHSVIIKTNVVWTGAEFIIDDSDLNFIDKSHPYTGMDQKYIFDILPDDEDEMVKLTDKAKLQAIVEAGLNPNTTHIDVSLEGWDGKLMLIPYNSTHKVYRRRMYGQHLGESAHEVIEIDKDGNVSPDTPIMFDYPGLDYIEIYKLNPDNAITIEGGSITTRACELETNLIMSDGTRSYKEAYIKRSIYVSRAYTTIKNLKHYITGEMAPIDQVDENGNIVSGRTVYSGFLSVTNTSYFTAKDCTFTARRCYARPGGGTGGTYGISGTATNFIVFDGCDQSNFWVTVDASYANVKPASINDPGAKPSMCTVTVNGKSFQLHWGIGGTNYCKNMQYINSTLSRFDAHQGLCNGKIIDSTVNAVALTGVGDFYLENSTVYAGEQTANNTVSLRNDYGATWNGNVYIKDTKHYTFTSQADANLDYYGTYILGHTYQNWYFGYQCALPNLYVDNLDFYDIQTFEPVPAGYKVGLARYVDAYDLPKIHLETSSAACYIPIYDGNGDGYIDEMPMDINRDGVIDAPIDIDGNGVAGETDLNYSNIANSVADIRNGLALPGNYTNLNVIKPPEIVKIINNDGVNGAGGYDIIITNTSTAHLDASQRISDGAWYDNVENWGGFYGDTKFYYGDGENDYVLGTTSTGAHNGQFRFGKYNDGKD